MREPRYSVVPSRVWRHDDGRQVSPFGAAPISGVSLEGHAAYGWHMVDNGFTIYNRSQNTYGVYGLRHIDRTDRNAVQELTDKLNGQVDEWYGAVPAVWPEHADDADTQEAAS